MVFGDDGQHHVCRCRPATTGPSAGPAGSGGEPVAGRRGRKVIPEITSDAPENCPDCGELWSALENVYTGDAAAHEGYEDWRYCKKCKCELFYPNRLSADAESAAQKEQTT